MHLSNSFPTALSTILEMEKHVEHACGRTALSRTEINGSRRKIRDPARIGCVTVKPLPRAVEESTFILELHNFTAVEAVTAADVMIIRPLSLTGYSSLRLRELKSDGQFHC